VSGGVALAVALRLSGAWAQGGPAPPTRATFVSTSSAQWDVVVDDQPMCSTPCSGPLSPLQFVVLRSHEPRPVLLELGRLPPGELLVSGKPLEGGKYAGGVVATTLGGMALVIGATFLAVGLAKDRAGMTTAGAITGAAGAIALPGGILLMINAVPSATVERAPPGAAAGIAGTF
jgi:hypothetical protein